jgi:hypothetical protein
MQLLRITFFIGLALCCTYLNLSAQKTMVKKSDDLVDT